jgi:dipeptidyl aminopeptidase/acylaminoacyl peptidase
MGSPTQARRIYHLNLTTFKLDPIDEEPGLKIDKEYLSLPQAVTYPSANGRIAHGYFYPPKNKDYTAQSGELPPLILITHGGPTAQNTSTFNLKIQYWTSRGFAVFDVNYGGSTGYGRAYRDSLKGNWGVIDVEDCDYAAQYAVKQGWADPNKLIIRGGSAGGFTVLAALASSKTFKCGASYAGVADLKGLIEDTHKFELHYLDQLIGPYPECKQLYEERSPLQQFDKISCPVIFFQGAEDKIVPLKQAQKMHHALEEKGIKTELIVYPGEEHGFRIAQNIQDSLEKELRFYSDIFTSATTAL